MRDNKNLNHRKEKLSREDIALCLEEKKREQYPRFLEFISEKAQESGITASQLRKVYNNLVGISELDPNTIIKKLVDMRLLVEYNERRGQYKKNRHGNGRSEFYIFMTSLLDDLIKNPDTKRVKNFEKTMEAIVAFSKK